MKAKLFGLMMVVVFGLVAAQGCGPAEKAASNSSAQSGRKGSAGGGDGNLTNPTPSPSPSPSVLVTYPFRCQFTIYDCSDGRYGFWLMAEDLAQADQLCRQQLTSRPWDRSLCQVTSAGVAFESRPSGKTEFKCVIGEDEVCRTYRRYSDVTTHFWTPASGYYDATVKCMDQAKKAGQVFCDISDAR